MWLIVSLFAALVATVLFCSLKEQRKKFRLDLLALMLWGMTIMVFVDHSISYLEGEPFIELTTNGLIPNATLLGFAMLVPVLTVWAVAAFTPLGEAICAG